eukprot:16382703-Heterocapsa_arctica.AAC.1
MARNLGAGEKDGQILGWKQSEHQLDAEERKLFTFSRSMHLTSDKRISKDRVIMREAIDQSETD